MAHQLPKLNFKYRDLEPRIDAQTMEIHYSKHHQAYVDNLNKALEGEPELAKLTVNELLKNIEQVPEPKKQAVINNAGGHANHTFFWEILTPGGSMFDLKNSEFKNLFEGKFKDLDTFKASFTERAMSVFGSGWCFLILTPGNKLELKRHSFQNSPIMQGNTPLLGIDLWEHAYYLKYQNRKKEYIDAFWNVVNWDQVETNFVVSGE